MNIFDYLNWRGDILLSVDPFNEVDALCFAEAAYTKIDEYIKESDKINLKMASDLFFDNYTTKDINDSKTLIAKAPLVLKALGESERFRNCILHDFVSIFSEKNVVQFCAFEVDLSDEITIVAFRGTDDSAIGWQEDFEMSYKIIPAQKQAELYVEKHCNDNKKYILLGHSKGGNLAAFASLHVSKTVRDKIIHVYSFDGPGLNENYYDKNIVYELGDRYTKFIPEFDFFGAVFEDNEKCKVIKADAFALMQHDALSWQINRNHFIYSEKTTPESDIIRKGIAEFMNSVNQNQREVFFKELFDALKELNLNSIHDLSKVGLPAFIRTVKKVSEMDEKSKDAGNKVIDIVTKIFSQMIEAAANEAQDKIDTFTDNALAFAKENSLKFADFVKDKLKELKK